ncbi:hypothetical protein PO124_03930 [Bacillus licheniformis]|nr:hypothetical protein [Bacillus licheniformis]
MKALISGICLYDEKSLFDLGYILDEELFYSIRLADWKGDSPGVRAEWGRRNRSLTAAA